MRAVDLFPPDPPFYVGDRASEPQRNFETDLHTGWRMKPWYSVVQSWGLKDILYQSNAQGFRSPRDFVPTASRMIAVVGDSHSYGVGVPYEHTYGALLESSMKETVVYNFSMPGFGVDQMWQSIRHQVLPLEPDLVIVGLYPADFPRSLTAHRVHEHMNKPRFKLVDGELVPATEQDRPNALVRFLERSSYLWQACTIASHWLSYRRPVGEMWHLNRAILDAIQEDCRAAGVPVLFLYIPYRSWKPFATLRDYFAATGARFLDLTDLSVDDPELLFFADGHLSGRGNQLAAAALRARLGEFLEGEEGAPP